MCVCARAYVRVWLCACVRGRMRAYALACMRVCWGEVGHVRVRARAHTHTQTHTHTQVVELEGAGPILYTFAVSDTHTVTHTHTRACTHRWLSWKARAPRQLPGVGNPLLGPPHDDS